MYWGYPQLAVLHHLISTYPHSIYISSEVNISLDMANLHMINISSLNCCIWQHLEKHQNEGQLQHLASIPSVPGGQLYSHMTKGIQHITPFSPEESTGDTDFHIQEFMYFFWCWPARLACQPLQLGTTQYTIVDDDVEKAPTYRCDGKASQPIRPRKNHGPHIEHIPTWMESWCKQQMQSLVVPAQGSLVNTFKIQGTQKCT